MMEIEDSAYTLLDKVESTYDPKMGFKDCDVAILVGAKPRGPGMERVDLLKQNAKIFEEAGQALDEVAKKTVKVLVVGNPAMTNSMICSKNAPSIPNKNFTALSRLD